MSILPYVPRIIRISLAMSSFIIVFMVGIIALFVGLTHSSRINDSLIELGALCLLLAVGFLWLTARLWYQRFPTTKGGTGS